MVPLAAGQVVIVHFPFSDLSTSKLRYICRLYAKELVLRNFVGVPAEQLLERLIELTLYTEENLK